MSADLAAGSLRERLAPLVGIRALLPQAEVELQRWTLSLTDGREKTVLRLRWEEGRVAGGLDGAWFQLTPRLYLSPVKGYRKPLLQAAVRLAAHDDFQPAGDDVLEEVLQLLGRRPDACSGKPEVSLRPEQPAGEALCTILLQLLEIMELNREGTREAIDSEFLHDFRVAVRRTRSALAQVKGVLPEPVSARFRKEFAWLGEITGPLRDLDVALLAFPDYQACLPAAQREDLLPLRDLLETRQREARRLLSRRLVGKRYRQLVEEWHRWLRNPEWGDPLPPKAMRPIAEVASKRIAKLAQRAFAEGEAIAPTSPAEALHELRKTCKKLRYLLEFFASLYPGTHHGKLVKALKGLQDNLGTFQDLSVQIEEVEGYRRELAAQPGIPPATLRALDNLEAQFFERRRQCREEFGARFGRFAGKGTRRQLAATLAAGTAPEEADR